MQNLLHALFLIASNVLLAANADFDGDSFHGSIERSLLNAACFRLFSSEGDMGCRTIDENSIGILFEIRDQSDLTWATNLGLDVVYAIPGYFFNSSILSILESTKIKGIIVMDDSETWLNIPKGKFSTDASTPQGVNTFQTKLTIFPNYQWNPFGNGIAYRSLKYPVVRVDPQEIVTVRSFCAENRDIGYFTTRANFAKFQYYMGPAQVTSKMCLEWRDVYNHRSPQCLPIGGQSVWGSAGKLDSRNKVLAAVSIDSTATFHDIAYGANDAAATIASFLGAAEAIGKLDHGSFPKQLLFFAANADEWGYAGSRRFVEDITTSFNCLNEVTANESKSSGLPLCADPIYPNTMFAHILRTSEGSTISIDSALSLDQIGRATPESSHSGSYFYGHAINPSTSTITGTIANVAKTVTGVQYATVPTSGLPPTPLTSFARAIPNLFDNSAVISGYGYRYKDPGFHTHYDNSSHVSVDDVIRSSELFAKSLVSLAGGDPSQVSINTTWVSSALHCLLTDWECNFISQYTNFEKKTLEDRLNMTMFFDSGTDFTQSDGSPRYPPSYYTGVMSPYSGRQPTVTHNGVMYGRYSGKWDYWNDEAYVIPNLLESFIRSTISYHLGDRNMLHFYFKMIDFPPNSAENNRQLDSRSLYRPEVSDIIETVPCETTADCAKYTCAAATDITTAKLECMLGVCLCSTAYYHIALDPGIQREATLGLFEVVNTSLPCYTEPNWSSDVGVVIYPAVNFIVTIIAITIGSVFTILR